VSQAATTTLTGSANPAPVGQPLVLTVTVTPAFTGAGAPTGIVMLRDGSNTIVHDQLQAMRFQEPISYFTDDAIKAAGQNDNDECSQAIHSKAFFL